MRKVWLAGAVLAISACSGGNNGGNDANAVVTDNLATDTNMTADTNITDSVNAAAANGSIDANTQAAMQADANTHDHDTNLANGL